MIRRTLACLLIPFASAVLISLNPAGAEESAEATFVPEGSGCECIESRDGTMSLVAAVDCKRVTPLTIQTAFDCIDGTWHKKEQELWECKDGDNSWNEWRDTGIWQDTGEPCE